MKFKTNDNVVYDDPNTPNNLVMKVSKSTYKSSGMDMVSVKLPSGIGQAFASQLRMATPQEIKTGLRINN